MEPKKIGNKKYLTALKLLNTEFETHRQRHLDQYLDDTRKNIDIVHHSFLPQSRSHFKQHTFDVYNDDILDRRRPYSEKERQEMQREVTLLSIQLAEPGKGFETSMQNC